MDLKWKLSSFVWKVALICKRKYRIKNYCVFVGLLAFSAVTYCIIYGMEKIEIKSSTHSPYIEDKEDGCEMPKMDPFSSVAMEYNKDWPKVVCDNVDWVECYMSECSVVKSILEEMTSISCLYKDIVYVTDHKYYIADSIKVDGADKYMLNRSDHVKVSCTGYSKHGIGLMSSRWFGYKAGLRPVPVRTSPQGRENTTNIMILCFDSASHNGVIRKMPKTYKFLQEDLNAVILKSYNIVGEGTSNALYPILAGLDLPDWETFPKDKCMDLKHFLFYHLKEDGYRTAYFEDMPWIGTFQRFYGGFSERPADHYLRAFLMEESQEGRKWWHGVRNRFCIGNIAEYALMLKLSEQFLSLDGKRFCLTFIADISHDDFNIISTADDDVVAFLRAFINAGRLEDTLLIVMGDHGAKYESLRKTYQGRIEERLPLVSIRLPEQLKRQKPSALTSLQANAEVLTSPYDLHTTLLDVVGLGKLRNEFKVPGCALPRGMNLLEPIPKTRSCGEAGISTNWCACIRWRNISQTESIYKRAAQELVDYINNLIQDHRNLCAKRYLTSIEWVMRKQPHRDMMRLEYIGWFFRRNEGVVRGEKEYYQVKVTMSPGPAIFEASMIYYGEDDIFFIKEQDISRINAYGDEPHCVSEKYPHLNKYCYCLQPFQRKDDFVKE